MADNVKIVMVGGGSYNWCPRLLSDLIQTEEMNGSEVVLLDPNIEAAEEVEAAAGRIAKNFGRKIKFVCTSDENKAFRNADFIVITISTGGLEMMRHDIEIPEKYGIYQTVADSVGPGGWIRLLRNVPVFVNMARKIEKLSPNAVILNYTNPMAGLTGAVTRVSSLKTVGLCHGLFDTYNIIKKLFAVDEKDISVNYGGINHFFWLLDFKVKGEPAYPLLREKLASSSIDECIDGINKGTELKRKADHVLCDELFRQYGYLTYIEDRHTCEYFAAYLTDKKIMEKFKLVRTSIEDRVRMREKNRKYTAGLASGTEKIPPKSRETAIDIIKAFVTNKPFVDVVNLPNIGQIDNLPRGAVVETLGHVNSMGFMPIAIGAVPEKLKAFMEPHCHVQKMTLDAALTADKELALDALMIDPLSATLPPSDIRKMAEELLTVNSSYLPKFK